MVEVVVAGGCEPLEGESAPSTAGVPSSFIDSVVEEEVRGRGAGSAEEEEEGGPFCIARACTRGLVYSPEERGRAAEAEPAALRFPFVFLIQRFLNLSRIVGGGTAGKKKKTGGEEKKKKAKKGEGKEKEKW